MKFDLSQRNYTNVKDAIIRESVKQGIIERDSLSEAYRIDREAIDSIFDFLVEKEDIILK